MIRSAYASTVIALALLMGCAKESNSVNKTAVQPMLGAVMHYGPEEVKALADQGVGLEERDVSGSTPMIVAALTDQWPSVEVLMDHGANIWAHDEFGVTAAQNAVTSHILRGSVEDQARLRVIEKLKARGYPFPPPGRDEILALEQRGEWPPRGAKR